MSQWCTPHWWVKNMLFQKKSIHLPWKVIWFEPSHPSRNSSLHVASRFLLQVLAFKTLLLVIISNDLPWGGYRYFLKPHNFWHSQITGQQLNQWLCPRAITFTSQNQGGWLRIGKEIHYYQGAISGNFLVNVSCPFIEMQALHSNVHLTHQ